MNYNNDLQRVYTDNIHKAPVRVNRGDEAPTVVTIQKQVASAMEPFMAMFAGVQAKSAEKDAMIAELQSKLAEKESAKTLKAPAAKHV